MIWIKNEIFFLIAFLDRPKKEVRIITAIKYKNLSIEAKIKKDKLLFAIHIRAWDKHSERMETKPPMILKGIEGQLPALAAYQTLSREK